MTLTTSRTLSASVAPLVTVIANPAIRPEDFDTVPSVGGGSGSGFLSREHIIEATETCFAENGYDGTTIRAIASRLGCAVGSIYRYFGDKRSLLLAMAGRMFEPVVESLAIRVSGVTFKDSLAAYIDAAIAQPERYRLLMWLAGGDGPAAQSMPPDVIDSVISGWARLLDSREQAEQVWSTVHGMLSLGREPQQIVETVRALVHVAAAPLPPVAPADTGYTVASFEEDVTLL